MASETSQGASKKDQQGETSTSNWPTEGPGWLRAQIDQSGHSQIRCSPSVEATRLCFRHRASKSHAAYAPECCLGPWACGGWGVRRALLSERSLILGLDGSQRPARVVIGRENLTFGPIGLGKEKNGEEKHNDDVQGDPG